MYDIFFLSTTTNLEEFYRLKTLYPRIQLVKSPISFTELKNKSFTKMFWVIYDDLKLSNNFDLNTYKVTKWDDMYVHVFKNNEHYDGISLFPKLLNISQREFTSRFFIEKKEIDILASTPIGYDKFNITTYEDYLKSKEESTTDMFWAIWPDVIVDDTFKFDYKVPVHNHNIVHIFKNGEYFDGICLFPKNSVVSKREFFHRFFSEKKEIDILASTPKKYNTYSPTSYNEYSQITDDMFWLKWPEITIIDETVFNLYFSHHNSYDRRENHVFKNLCNNTDSYLSGLILCSKYKTLSESEFNNQYAVDKKEYNQIVSKFQYPVYSITDYADYLKIVNDETQKMFWCQWPNTEIIDTDIFDLYFDPNNGALDYDRTIHHVFKNLCDTTESYLSGLVLFSKSSIISKREFDRKYLIDKKEHDRIASRYRYNRYVISTYDEYKTLLETETQSLFWCVWPGIQVIDNTIFDLYFDPNDGKYDYDRSTNHVFKNLCNDTESYLSGVVLFSKSSIISKREFDRKYLIDKKEHDRIASRYRYPKFHINTYDQYQEILKNTDDMFWCVWPEIQVTDETIFDLYFDPNDGKYDYDRNINQVFLHKFRDTELTYNGLMLMSKNNPISKKEFDFRYPIQKKENEIIVSTHRLYDIVFISYNEPTADENFENLKNRFPKAKRVHGVKGIHNAHIRAAELAETEMFWVVDGDAIITENFNFSHVVSRYELNMVQVWRSQNPINNLIYGYGGVKLLPRTLTLNMDVNSTDMTTSISDQFKIQSDVSNITAFNTDPFNTWKSAFRECVKLASQSIVRQDSDETISRLNTWCSVGADQPFGEYAIRGAIEGRAFGTTHKEDPTMLTKINDFDWLKQQYGI